MPVAEPDDLYGLPLEQFIPERGALVKAIRQAGEPARAKEVQGLRKPSLAAWAVNQLMRTKRKEAAELFDAGDALQHAQSELLEGRGDGKALREAVARERDAVDALAAQARGLLSDDGHELTAATLEKVSDTLHAAALDPAAREQVEGGRLERELRHVGMGPFGGALAVAPPSSRPKRAAAKGRQRRGAEKDAEKAAKKEAEKAERERAEALKAARQAERDARRAAQRAERELQAARGRRENAATALAEAEEAVAAAREQSERTARAHDETEAEIERLTSD